MPTNKKELTEALRSAVKTLILQEIRIIQLEQTHSPPFILDEMNRSVREAKGRVIDLVREMSEKERDILVKKVIRQSVEQEIDQGVRTRTNRCLRCIHVRYFDEEGRSQVRLPLAKGRACIIGCEMVPSVSRKKCQVFVESSTATPLEDYLNEMSLLYEFKEMIDQIEEIWKNYLKK